MNKSICKLTVLFQEPFWIGVFEGEYDNKYNVARVVFGAEPTEAQLYQFVLDNYYKIPFKETSSEEVCKEKKISYKRKQRIIKKQQKEEGIGTKAQNAIKAQQETAKKERIKKTKELKEEEKERMFKLKQIKRKEKHKGH